MEEKDSFLRELALLLPFFILHLSSGMTGSFTTILIEHYDHMKNNSAEDAERSAEDREDMTEAMIGTFQDIPPIIVAVLGGFLQQLFGPRKLLIVCAIPSIMSWVFVAVFPSSITFILLSRFSAGLANGLLSGNVYLSNIASPKYIGSFKMVEIASKNVGCILLFLEMICFRSFGLSLVSLLSAVFPVIGLIGMFFARESPFFNERHKISREISIEANKNPIKSWLKENLERLKIPILSPTVFKPLLLITALIIMQQCSGAVFIKKFIIQILSANEEGTAVDEKEDDNKRYLLPIVILTVRLIVIFMMTFLLQKFRVRFLYFLSLFLTVLVLFSLGLISHDSISSYYFLPSTIQYVKTILLCSHVFFIQFGIQTLPGLLIDILFPTACKAVMKGLTRAIGSICLILFVFIFKSVSYGNAFFIMGSLLLLLCPLLYVVLPEIRNIGTDMSAEFFLPSQTVFYFVLPEKKTGSPETRQNAKKRWHSAVRKISNISSVFDRVRVHQEIGMDNHARIFNRVNFDHAIPQYEDVHTNEKYAKLNKERLSFVANILGHNGFLCENPWGNRVLIGRGPIKYKSQMVKRGNIFLFSDVIILAKCVVANRRYVGETYFKLDNPDLKVLKLGKSLTFSANTQEDLVIELEDESLATIWERHIDIWRVKQVNVK